MMKNSIITLGTFFFLLGIFFTCSENNPTEPKNNSPKIIDIIASKDTVGIFQNVDIKVIATDLERDSLDYTWSSNAGNFISDNSINEIVWKSPGAVGNYFVTVYVNDGSSTSKDSTKIVVTNKPILEVSKDTLYVTSKVSTEEFYLLNIGTSPLQWNINIPESWLTLNQTSATLSNNDTSKIVVTALVNQLPLGISYGKINITSNGGEKQILVIADIGNDPKLYTNTSSLYFPYPMTNAKLVLKNTGTGTLNWSISDDSYWLSVNYSNGSLTSDSIIIDVNINRPNLSQGLYTGNLNIESNGGDTTITVEMEIIQTAEVNGNCYYFQTLIPIDGVGLQIDSILTISNSDGYYQFPEVPIGVKSITTTKNGYDTYQNTINVTGSSITHNIEMTSDLYTTNFDGTVISDFDGLPVEGVTVSLLNPDNSTSNLSTITNNEGRFYFNRIPLGSRNFRFSIQEYEEYILNLNISCSISNMNIEIYPTTNLQIGGEITSDLILKEMHSPYIVTSSLNVNSGVTLTIEPGTILKFVQYAGFNVEGTLLSEGTIDKQIVFTTNHDPKEQGTWYGLHLSSETSILRNALLEYGGTALNVTNCSPQINNCIFQNFDQENADYGPNIFNFSGTNLVFSNNIIRNCKASHFGLFKVVNYSPDTLTFINNLIYDNVLVGNNNNHLFTLMLCNVKNNILYNNSESSTKYSSIFYTLAYSNKNIINNLIVSNQFDRVFIGDFGVIKNNIFANSKGILDGFTNIITNNIFIDNSGGINLFGSYTLYDYNCFYNTSGFTGGTNTLFVDPLIVNPNYTNPINGDWHLQSNSPCIGAGYNGVNIGLSNPDNIGPQD